MDASIATTHGTRFLVNHGVRDEELELFLAADCAPDIVGINHYLTSERYLDETTERYPAWSHGGNHRHRYADVEAVRVDLPAEDLGPKSRLSEAWERYRRPIAVTEAHHGSTRDEQVRWLIEVWSAAEDLRAGGQDIRAVTVWSLFGAIDWNSRLLRKSGFYEPGAFDIRGPGPRRTAVGTAAGSLAKTGAFDHRFSTGMAGGDGTSATTIRRSRLAHRGARSLGAS